MKKNILIIVDDDGSSVRRLALEAMAAAETSPLEARMMVAAPASLEDFMVMAGGAQTVRLTQNGKPLAVVVDVNPASAAALNAQLAAVSERTKQKPYFGFDHKKDETRATAWPKQFYWNENTNGLHAIAEASAAGKAAVEGRDYRGFSMVFHVDDVRKKPAQIICNPSAGLNMGGLTNEPAFHDNQPLWASEPGIETTSAADGSAAGTAETKQINKMKEETTTAVAAPNAAADNAGALQARETKITTLEAENTALKARDEARRKGDAKAAVQAAVKRGALAAQNSELQAKWENWCAETPEMIDALNAMEGKPALESGRVTPPASGMTRLEAREGADNIIKALGGLVKQSRLSRGFGQKSSEERADLSRQMAALYARDVSKNPELQAMPLHAMSGALEAAAALDTLGTVAGTLVVQRTLEFFRINYPMFQSIYTDFSDQPAMLNQTIDTRIVSKPAVQTYSATLGADGRPGGWSTASAATTTSVTLSLDEHVGVPVVFDANTLSSTIRRLFDEQAPAMAYALAAYFVAKIYGKITAANFNAYAAVNGAKVPVAYATYVKAVGDFARSAAVDLNAIFNPNEVPLHDRALLLNSAYYAAAGKDPSLVTFWAAQRNPELITEGELPRMSKFTPIEAPDFPVSNNRVGFAFQKNALCAISRVPQDYSKILPGASYGNVTQISDPQTGMTIMLVEYVNHTGGYAEMRMETYIGAGKGDSRAGLVITSQ